MQLRQKWQTISALLYPFSSADSSCCLGDDLVGALDLFEECSSPEQFKRPVVNGGDLTLCVAVKAETRCQRATVVAGLRSRLGHKVMFLDWR